MCLFRDGTSDARGLTQGEGLGQEEVEGQIPGGDVPHAQFLIQGDQTLSFGLQNNWWQNEKTFPKTESTRYSNEKGGGRSEDQEGNREMKGLELKLKSSTVQDVLALDIHL